MTKPRTTANQPVGGDRLSQTPAAIAAREAKKPAQALADHIEAGKAGRPRAYRPEFDEVAFKLCLLGATDVRLADFFGINQDTLNSWKADHPTFSESLVAGKEGADAEIAHSLYQRARGYSHPDVYASNFQGSVTLTPITKHYPPDTGAATLWLKNRQPGTWRDKVDMEHQGPGGGPVKVDINLTADEAYKLMVSFKK